MKHRRLIIGSIVAIAIGSILWAVTGPAVVLMGTPTPRTSEDNRWPFFQAYSTPSYPPSTEETPSTISPTYWLGFAVSVIGLSILAAGVIGIILATVRKMRARKVYRVDIYVGS